ncbi:MAG: hypothetical protein AB1585_07505 [Thermodesulfobacteriota bacterium]
MQEYLEPTYIIDAGAEAIQKIAKEMSGDSQDDIQKAVRLFYFVRTFPMRKSKTGSWKPLGRKDGKNLLMVRAGSYSTIEGPDLFSIFHQP